MQPRNALLLFVLAVALGAFVYLYEIKGEAGREAAEGESRRMFPGVEADAIGFVAFRTQGDHAFEAAREGEGWLIQSPVAFPGDDVNLDAIASTLANLKTDATVEDPAAPEIYGLGEAARWVRFRVGSETHGLGIGADTPVGGDVYVAREGADGAIHTVPAFRVSAFDRDLTALRDRRVLDFDRTRVVRIVVGWEQGNVTLERGEDGWVITQPSEAAGKADESTVDGLLSDVAFLRAEGFVDEAVQAVEQAPFVTLRLGLEAEQGEPLEIGLRAVADPSSDDFLVRGDNSDALYQVPRARLTELPRDVFDYRFKQLTNFEVADAQAFELVLSTPSVERSVEPLRVRVERAEQGWKSDGAPWVAGKAAGLIAELARLEAVSVVSENADAALLERLGLDPPRVSLRAYGAAGEGDAPLLAEVVLGELDPLSGIAARASGQETIFRIDGTLAESIPIDIEAFESQFIAEPADDEAPSGS